MSPLGWAIRALRKDRKATQESLAAAAGVALSTLRKIEDGRVGDPGYFTVLAICESLDATLEDLEARRRLASQGD